jgi:hypothetical protein
MSDIVGRLRAIYSTHPMVMEAADEIERLRNENEAWQIGQEAVTDQLSSRNREITRLRAVIRDAADDLLTPDALRAAIDYSNAGLRPGVEY